MRAIKSLLSVLLLTKISASEDAPCGKKRPKLQGGVEWPWLACIAEQGTGDMPDYVCMGTLISKNHILTAAHCFDAKSLDTRKYTAQLESYSTHSGTTYNIEQIDLHPLYIPGSTYADLAMLTLDTNVTAISTPICLPNATDMFDYKPSFVAEWLPKAPGGPYQLKAQRALVSTNEACRMQYSSLELDKLHQGITKNELCTDIRSNQGSCFRLNASSMMIPDRSIRWVLASIATYRHDCEDQSYPGIYTRISQYLPWIQTFVEGAT